MTERYSRQVLFFPSGNADQDKLRRSRVALVGCGALGTVMVSFLARAGVGYLRIIDRDFVELSNLQRQTLFDEEDVRQGLPKAVAATRSLARTNSEIVVEGQVADFESDNAERLLRDVDLVMDASDNFDARYLINDVSCKLGKPWIYSAGVGSYGVTLTIRPGVSPCLRCVFPVEPAAGTTASCETAGVIAPATGVIGSLASAEALKLLIGAVDHLRPGLLWIDVWNNTYQSTPLVQPAANCPTCQLGHYEHLERRASGGIATLCGRNAVQVRPRGSRSVRLDQLAERLEPIGQVFWNDFLLRFSIDNFEITVFPDARAIVKGTDDTSIARGLYARYVGG